jgi:hypothetical protein
MELSQEPLAKLQIYSESPKEKGKKSPLQANMQQREGAIIF